MTSRVALLLALVCCLGSWVSASVQADKEFENFVAHNNIELRATKFQSNCIDLWGTNFDETVLKGRWMVFFSASWSSESRRMNSIWEEFTQLARLHHPQLKFARVSCDNEHALCTDRLGLSSFPHIIGVDEGLATVMQEPLSNDGLNEFVSTGWQRRKAERLPSRPDALYLRYQRFSKGVENLFHVPLPHMLMGLLACACVPIVCMGYLILQIVRETPVQPIKNKAG